MPLPNWLGDRREVVLHAVNNLRGRGVLGQTAQCVIGGEPERINFVIGGEHAKDLGESFAPTRIERGRRISERREVHVPDATAVVRFWVGNAIAADCLAQPEATGDSVL